MIDNKGDKTFETDTEVKSISEITGQVSNVNKSLLLYPRSLKTEIG